MSKTYDGKTIGNTYRFIPDDARVSIQLCSLGSIASLLFVPMFLLSIGAAIFPALMLAMLVSYFFQFQIIIKKYHYREENPRSFTCYKIISESMDDAGNISTLIEWQPDGERERFPYRAKAAERFKFISE